MVEVLARLGMMDKRGTGFMRIREALDKFKMPHPELEEKQGYFVIRFVNPLVHKIPKIDEYKLNERQKKALKRVKVKGRITNKEYVNLNKVSRITATRELMDRVRKKILKQEGRGRGSRFIPMMQL